MSKMREVLDFLSNCERGMASMRGQHPEAQRANLQAARNFRRAKDMLHEALTLPAMVPERQEPPLPPAPKPRRRRV